MRNCVVFVGGPIQHAIDSQGRFHIQVKTTISTIISDLRSNGYVILSAHEHENFGEMDVRGKSLEVCARDLEWMKECAVFVAVLPIDQNGEAICSMGTAVELGWASAMGKPIIIVCDPMLVYSHLINGLGAVARVVTVDINRTDFTDMVRVAMAGIVENLIIPEACCHIAEWSRDSTHETM